MPRGDGTGPMGMGSMTGRGAGFCAGIGQPGFRTAGPRCGMGFGRGFGRGLGRGAGWRIGGHRGAVSRNPNPVAYAGSWDARQVTREEELAYLRNQAGVLKEELDAISGRMRDLEGESAGDQR